MKKTILPFLLLAIITGLLFTACTSETEENVLVDGFVKEGVEDDDVMINIVKYADGVYEAPGFYESPAGEESISVKVTLLDGVVSDVEVVGNATHEKSISLQNMFIEGIGAEVVGMKLDEIPEFDQVNGSSLTPIGFSDALEDVKKEAALSVDS